MGRVPWLLFLALAGLLWVAQDTEASHLRGGSLEWAATGQGNEVEFDGRLFGQWAYGNWAVNNPREGDVVLTGTLDSGDGGSVSFSWIVEFVSDAGTPTTSDDWFSARLRGGTDGGPKHTYPALNNSGAPYIASWATSARIGDGDGHVNNGCSTCATGFRLETAIDLAPAGLGSPQVLFPPIVPCERDTLCTFKIPSLGNESRAFRFSTSEEATGTAGSPGAPPLIPPSGFIQPGHDQFGVDNAAIAADGTYTWNTTGATDSEAEHTYYSTQVMVEDANGKAPMDFFIELVDELADRPYWLEDPCDAEMTIFPGDEFVIRRQATADVRTTISVDILGLPKGASVERYIGGGLSDPGWAEMTWTPDEGARDSLIVFGAYSASGAQAPACSITLKLDINDPPVADFDHEASRYWVGDPIQFTDLSDAVDPGDSIVNWTWKADGLVWSHDQHPKRSFDRVDSIPVDLTVQDMRGGQATVRKFIDIVNAAPVANFTAPNDIVSGTQVIFQDNSTDEGLGDRIESWHWDLDGVEADGQTLAWTFEQPGRVGVCLTVTDTFGASDRLCRPIEVRNRAPSVTITVAPGNPEGSTGVDYFFTCDAEDLDGQVLACHWTFDDGATASGFQVRHAFATARDTPYLVRVRAVDDLGTEGTAAALVAIDNQAPFVRFSYHREAEDPIERVRFSSESYDLGGGALEHTWDFGDGTSSKEPAPIHTFDDPDQVYRIELRVKDADNATSRGVLLVRPADLSGIQDSDGDGLRDGQDNCPFLANEDQRDGDGDGQGDVCDGDRDGDGVQDADDAFPDDRDESMDLDGDGIGDEADDDDDGDGLRDAEEAILGTDPRVADSDGDGIPDRDEILDQTDPNDAFSPDWRARNVAVTHTGNGWEVTWDAPTDARITGFEILVDGVVIATVMPNEDGIYAYALSERGEIQVRSILANGLSAPLETAVATPEPPCDCDPVLWPWFVGGGALVAGAGTAGFILWRRR